MTQFKLYSKPKKLLHGTGDPTDDYLIFKDPNAEERYEQYCSENEVPDAISEYVTSLERENKLLRAEIKNLKYPKTSLSMDDLKLLTQPRKNG